MTLRAAFVTDALATLDVASTHEHQSVTMETWAQTAYETVLNMMARTYNFAALLNEDESVTTTADTFTYTLPNDTNRLFRIVWENGSSSATLRGMSPRKFDCKYPYPSSLGSGIPSDYTRRNDTTIDICVPPSASNKVLRIYRSLWPTADDSTPCQFTRMDDIIVAGMVSELYHKMGIDSDANTWWTKFRQKLDVAWKNDINYPDRLNMANPFYRSREASYASGDESNPFVKQIKYIR